MKIIPAGKFKTHCLSLIKEVAKKHETVVVTKYGKPIARLIPYSASPESTENPLKNSIVFEKDIVEPIAVEWDVLK